MGPSPAKKKGAQKYDWESGLKEIWINF